jgi:histidinol-phosphate/aromatic aminotransferase/cobyric acid decarboxylase-like protein
MTPKISINYNFATNVNPLGPPDWAFEQLSAELTQLTYYNELWHQKLDELLTSYWQLQSGKMIATTGSSELIFQLPFLLNCLHGPWLVLDPTFWEYALLAKTHAIPYESFKIIDDNGKMFSEINISELLNFAKLLKPRMMFICNPNNPTGHLIKWQDIHKIAEELPDTWIIVDQTYAYFLENWSEEKLPHDNSPENIISITSFSKFFCLPGLRLCAIGCSSSKRMAILQNLLGPIRLNGIAANLLPNLLTDSKYHRDTRSHFKLGWPKFLEELQSSFLCPLPSEAIFRLFEVTASENSLFQTETDLGDQLADRLIKDYGIRICSGTTYGLKNQVRIRLGTNRANQILISALENLSATIPL